MTYARDKTDKPEMYADLFRTLCDTALADGIPAGAIAAAMGAALGAWAFTLQPIEGETEEDTLHALARIAWVNAGVSLVSVRMHHIAAQAGYMHAAGNA